MEATEHIVGADKVTDVFGRWPSFHDGTVKDLRFIAEGPRIEAVVHGFTITNETEPTGYLRLDHHSLVTFRFDKVRNVGGFGGFGQYNEVACIVFDYLDEPEGEPHWRIAFDNISGFGLDFECGGVEVVTVEPITVPATTETAEEAAVRRKAYFAEMKRPTIAELNEEVDDREAFLIFIRMLLEDRIEAVTTGKRGYWRNMTISQYLAGCLRAVEEQDNVQWGLRSDANWHDFAWFMRMGREG